MPAKPTKPDNILKHIRRKAGASMADLEKATGWQAHSVRAALTGLRKKGIAIKREDNPKRGSVYKAVEE